MDTSTIISFTVFALVAGFTPGPNNIMLAASGANFGFKKTVPHILGIVFGFCTLVLAAGLGLGELFELSPWIYKFLKILSFIYLIYLAWRIGSAGKPNMKRKGKPLSFFQAASFQLINPKAITVIISSVTAYTTTAQNVATEMTVFVFVFAFAAISSTCTWTFFGTWISKLITSKRSLRQFNIFMAILLIASLMPAILEPV